MRLFSSKHTRCFAIRRILASTLPKFCVRVATRCWDKFSSFESELWEVWDAVSSAEYNLNKPARRYHQQDYYHRHLSGQGLRILYCQKIYRVLRLERDTARVVTGRRDERALPKLSLMSQQLLTMTSGTFRIKTEIYRTGTVLYCFKRVINWIDTRYNYLRRSQLPIAVEIL